MKLPLITDPPPKKMKRRRSEAIYKAAIFGSVGGNLYTSPHRAPLHQYKFPSTPLRWLILLFCFFAFGEAQTSEHIEGYKGDKDVKGYTAVYYGDRDMGQNKKEGETLVYPLQYSKNVPP